MKNFLILFTIATATLLTSCQSSKETFTFTGKLQKIEMSTFQYGTHTIENGTSYYALKSEILDLDAFKDKDVTVVGKKVEGYPLEGGPELIEVAKVKE